MGLIVQKFGGTSVKDAERLNNVADIVTSTYKEGNDVVVVVSAQGDTTDDLIAKAADPQTKIISFTVTEAGYYLDPKNVLDTTAADIANDLAAVKAGKADLFALTAEQL